MTEEEKRKMGRLVGLLAGAWHISWFAAIWITRYSLKLFLTGLFCFFIGLVFSSILNDEKRKNRKEQS